MLSTSEHATGPAGSERRYAALSIGLLAGATLAYLGALEIGARVLYPMHSTITGRMRSDWSAARQLGVSRPHDRSFLVVGNSLLQEGIDRKELRTLQQGSALSITILPVENTEYLDWYFGVARLLGEGSRPEFVVLCLLPWHLTSDGTEGEFFARTLMRPADILRVKQAARLDWTTTSTYLMANFSAWMGNSAGIRNWIRYETVPGISELAAYFPQRSVGYPPVRVIEEIVAARLTQFAAMCAAHGCKALLVIPPMMRDRGSGSVAAVAGAARAGVPVLIPLAPGELAADFFSDGVHLNERGATIFTARLTEALQRFLRTDLPHQR
jgi:hypothetical protein